MGTLPDIIRSGFGAYVRRWCLGAILFGGWAFGSPVAAAGPFSSVRHIVPDGGMAGDSLAVKETSPHVSRALAAALAVTLGPFGAHRLYLGTTPKVPLIYGLTFGGFGVLVLIDLGHILCTRDLSAFQDNGQVLMWAKPREEGEITPP